jgi:DNA-binding transcriptional LysR family regulator
MDRLDAMIAFTRAAEAGSFSAAARRLRTPLATMSRRVAALEAHLGARLFRRTGRRLSLTEAGAAYLLACRRILEELEEAERIAAGEAQEPKGALSVAAPIAFGRLHVLPVVAEFLREHPRIDVRLRLSDEVVSLREEPVDVAVRIGALPDGALVARRVGTVRRVICASPAYLARRGVPASPDALADHDCVTFEGLAPAQRWEIGAGPHARSVPVHSRLVVNTAEAAVDAAVAGLGLTGLMSYQVAAAEQAGALVRVLQAHERDPAPVSLVHARPPPLPRKLRAFLDHAAPRLAARLAS